MSEAATYLTWDGDGSDELPRRPTIDDLGGDTKVDDDEFPPDDIEHFTAEGWNQKAKQIPALARVAESCKLEVRFDSGSPFVARAASPKSSLPLDTFTVVDNGTGDTSITWPANTFPPSVISPTGLTLLSSSSTPVSGKVQEITNGIRVRTHDNGAAADVAWTIDIN